MKIRRNHQIPSMIKAGVSTCAISTKFNMSYSGQKRLCTKLKSSGDCSRVPGSRQKLLIEVIILL